MSNDRFNVAFGRQPVNLNFLRRQLEILNSYPDHFDKKWFFKSTLLRFSSQLVAQDFVGHIIFRLSDFLLEEERNSLKIYPSDEGSAKDELGYNWFSLEDWRKEWQKYHEKIPDLTDLWPEARNYLP